jgi:hypothetical protein
MLNYAQMTTMNEADLLKVIKWYIDVNMIGAQRPRIQFAQRHRSYYLYLYSLGLESTTTDPKGSKTTYA